MQRQMLEQLGQEGGQRDAGVVGQVADQAPRGDIGAGLVEDVTGAFHIDVGLGKLNVGLAAPIAPVETPAFAGLRLLIGILLGDHRIGEEAGDDADLGIRRQDHGPDRAAFERGGGELPLGLQQSQQSLHLVGRQISAGQSFMRLPDNLLGLLVGRSGGLAHPRDVDVGQVEEAVGRAVAAALADEHEQAFSLKRGHQRLHALAPKLGQRVRVQQNVGKLAEQVGFDPPADRRVAPRPHQSEARIVDVGAAPLDAGGKLIVLQIAIEGSLGDVSLLVRIGDPGQLTGLLQGDFAQTQGLQRLCVQPGQGRQALDLQFVIAERAGDGGGVHLRLAQLADGDNHVGDVNGRALSGGEDGGRGLTFAGGEHLALHRPVLRDPSGVQELAERQQPAAAVQHHEGPLLPGPRSHAQGHYNVSLEDGFGQPIDLVVGRLLGAKVLRRDLKVAQGHELGVGNASGGFSSGGHGDHLRRQRRGSSCPLAHPLQPSLSPFSRSFPSHRSGPAKRCPRRRQRLRLDREFEI